MISIDIVQQKDKPVEKIHIYGHAQFDDYGKDIVCAGISMLTFTVINQIYKIEKEIGNTKLKESKVLIEENDITLINHTNNDKINLLFDTLLTGFTQTEQEYPDFVKITNYRSSNGHTTME